MRFAVFGFCLALGCNRAPAPSGAIDVSPALATEQLDGDPDDPSVWIHPTEPARSLIIATNKAAAPKGALVVFNLNGKIVQTIANLDRPNNVDVEYGLSLGGQSADVAVTTERYKRRLRVFRIAPDGSGLTDVSSGGGIPVFEGQPGEAGAPMGIALYRRPRDGAISAIVGRKSGAPTGYLWQYRLVDGGAGRVRGEKVREFGAFSGAGEIEAIAVDDSLGYVYYADEEFGIRKYHADPDHAEASRELAVFGRTGFSGNREGIAVYSQPGGAGFIVCTDQIAGGSTYHLYRREGRAGAPHDHSELIASIRGGADSTDGIEAVSAPLGSRFPQGLLVAMNSSGRNFLVFDWAVVAATLPVRH
jgi:3-phytase